MYKLCELQFRKLSTLWTLWVILTYELHHNVGLYYTLLV
jgi:hypothetical protein